MKYLKIVRAQLSNDEQIMLFYNWLAGNYNGGYGHAWEAKKNQFFTQYLMIHNLRTGLLFKDHKSFFIENKLEYLRRKTVKFERGPLFEWD